MIALQFTDNATITSLVYLVLNVILAVVASSMVVLIAPLASGSGIPELMTYFNNADIPAGFLSLKTFVVKVRITTCSCGRRRGLGQAPPHSCLHHHQDMIMCPAMTGARITYLKIPTQVMGASAIATVPIRRRALFLESCSTLEALFGVAPCGCLCPQEHAGSLQVRILRN